MILIIGSYRPIFDGGFWKPHRPKALQNLFIGSDRLSADDRFTCIIHFIIPGTKLIY